MPTYRVRDGFTHGAFNQHKAGDTVTLTEQEAAGFLDKLELVDGETEQDTTGTVTRQPQLQTTQAEPPATVVTQTPDGNETVDIVPLAEALNGNKLDRNARRGARGE